MHCGFSPLSPNPSPPSTGARGAGGGDVRVGYLVSLTVVKREDGGQVHDSTAVFQGSASSRTLLLLLFHSIRASHPRPPGSWSARHSSLGPAREPVAISRPRRS